MDFGRRRSISFSLILILVAGIELGLIGFFGFSVLTWLFGRWHFVAYDVIGVSGSLSANLSSAVSSR